ncbi:dethiobiotin synthase [Reinekea sp.]|jgi:dethiobiotin synthetase|uniref:dethiobiotin synthase n=1 Tax=Reinekea sp. TaxID=1970455 RepID=UPI00398A4406
MKRKYFITGTDTDAGKTFITVALLRAFAEQGYSTLGLKPIAAGSEIINGEKKNDDAVMLAQASSVQVAYQQTNPILLDAAMAPHIAAERENRTISASKVTGFVRGTLMTAPAQVTLIEGAGGWRVPLNARETFADVAKQLNIEVILVVGMKLGCLNHALLTTEAIKRDGLTIAGWVANAVDPAMEGLDENIKSLVNRIGAPLIGVMPHLTNPNDKPNQWIASSFLTNSTSPSAS